MVPVFYTDTAVFAVRNLLNAVDLVTGYVEILFTFTAYLSFGVFQ